jgi:hypothetical protein
MSSGYAQKILFLSVAAVVTTAIERAEREKQIRGPSAKPALSEVEGVGMTQG